MDLVSWLIWAPILIAQNFAFTFVSRARNSGSLKRHMIAGVFSNGVWFASQTIIFRALYETMTGRYGLFKAIMTGVFYTTFTLIGSLLAHWWSLKSEKGLARVGAYKKEGV